jgi:hypothetical protein
VKAVRREVNGETYAMPPTIPPPPKRKRGARAGFVLTRVMTPMVICVVLVGNGERERKREWRGMCWDEEREGEKKKKENIA